MTISLREYQEQVARQALVALESNSRVVVCCPTGSGKTVIATQGIIPNLQGSVLWITHRKELADQARGHASKADIHMVQSDTPISDYDNIVIDEGHHVCAGKYREIFRRFPNARFIALTATPYRLDGEGLGSVGFSTIIHGPDAYDLTCAGFLVPVRVYVPNSERTVAWDSAAVVERVKNEPMTRALVYCRAVADAFEIAKGLTDTGIPSKDISHNTPEIDRRATVKDFANGSVKVVCNHTIFTEGYDAPSVDLLVLNRFTESRCLWKQMMGRGLRLSPGKVECRVLDLAGNAVKHGSIYDREIYDLNGKVTRTQARQLPQALTGSEHKYEYNQGEKLKQWNSPLPIPPTRLHENLARLKSTSLLRRFLTA